MKRLISLIFTTVLAFHAITGSAAATIFTVDDDGPGNYTTIQSAVNEAVSGDVIQVKPGTYHETVNMYISNLVFVGEGYPEVDGFRNAPIMTEYGLSDFWTEYETIWGFSITKDGILMDGKYSQGNYIHDNYFYNCGVSLNAMEYGYDGDTIANNVFHGGGISLSYGGDGSQKITGNEIYDSEYGIKLGWVQVNNYIGEISGNKISGCDVGLDIGYDMRVASVHNNIFNNVVNVRIGEGSKVDQWNIGAPMQGTNIIGGPYLGGNFWGSPVGEGFSQTHQDANGDGIAEDTYMVAPGMVDYFPLVTPRTEPVPDPEPTPAPEVTPTPEENSTEDVTPTPAPEPAPENTPIPEETPTAEDSGSGSGSSGGSSHSSSSGGSGGGGGGSPEPAKNVEVKELSQVFITNGKAVNFEFKNNATCVVSVSFDAIRNVGKTTTVAEQLKNKSALVSELPAGEVYKSFNIWVGNAGYATSKNIENPGLVFKVEKAWIQDKKIDRASIALNRYDESVWTRLSVLPAGEDDKFLYFSAETPGYGSFVISGKSVLQVRGEDKVTAENRAVGDIQEGNETEGTGSNQEETGNTLLSIGIVTGALGVVGLVLKGMKK